MTPRPLLFLAAPVGAALGTIPGALIGGAFPKGPEHDESETSEPE
jgi:hypothetical protein